jgi:hypothetical protein
MPSRYNQLFEPEPMPRDDADRTSAPPMRPHAAQAGKRSSGA